MHRLLIVDDSPYYRMRFAKIFARSEALKVVGMADDGDVAIRQIIELKPDVVLLDLMMPRMDGFGVLRWAMAHQPLPIVVCSSFSDRERVFKALELGAVDFLLKPAPRASQQTSALETQIVRCVEEVAGARPAASSVISKDAKAAVLAAEREARAAQVELICIAASTGGPSAIQKLMGELPESLRVPILVVQHMPLGFTQPFAERLNALSYYTVREARDAEPLRRRHAYIAPAGRHATVASDGDATVIRITEAATEAADSFHLPSADAVFESAAQALGSRLLAVVLTGMGDDGARGAEAVRAAGGYVLAESNESAVVFGMPRAVIERGCANAMLPLAAMPQVLLAYAEKE
ncbi:MAG TPA: chemotaxis-specific protein-glutamate methyltransferase CheB [Blastocatellia bacterium]|nr:chemotaxis-specific protein-glutamate methyltransferase CheB [Blastocatellia bacterium]